MSIPQKQFRNIAYLSDVTGTGFWRHIQQMLTANAASQQLGIFNTWTQMPILDQAYYNGISSVTVQRWLTNQQHQLFMTFLKPVCDAYGAWLIYEIDDAMHYNDIPLWNKGRASFADDNIQANIKAMLNAADLVIVTTQHIKEYYNRKYGVPLNNILAVPNLLPRWWFGNKFNSQESVELKNLNKAKPRIGIVSSLSHYNIQNYKKTHDGKIVQFDSKDKKWKTADGIEVDEDTLEAIHDDIDEIVDVIEQTIDSFKWVFFGFCPAKLRKYADQKLIEIHGTTSILNYPNMLKTLKLQAIVAPLAKCEFNYCKSPIKFLECCAIGIPLIATRCLPYEGIVDDKMLFSTQDELKEKLNWLKFMSNGAYKQLIEKNFNWFNSPHDDGDFIVSNYWLDDNIKIWYDLFRLRRKTCYVSFDKFKTQHSAKLASLPKEVLYSKNGVEIVK